MSTQKLKSFAQRSSIFGVALAVLAGVVLPPTAVFADALNPLTERSLLLTSSAPGFQDTDGSGNSELSPNAVNTNYAPPGSGPNGKKTGQTFSFKVSTDSTVPGNELKGFSLQYCTSAAGICRAPGNNVGDAEEDEERLDTATTSDLSVNYPDEATAGLNQDFQILVGGVDASADWELRASNREDANYTPANPADPSDHLTGKRNFIQLIYTGAGAGITPTTGQQVQIIFNASTNRHITNPGNGAFFVKINTFKSNNPINVVPTNTTDIVDGGVTVANVMTDSIHITTKVLETMSFSVGTRNRDTVVVKCTGANVPEGCEDINAVHGTCDPIQQLNSNRLDLGNPNAEYSLETGRAWDVYSYWRLSSNSSGGATVYYSGNTLQNTVGDRIRPMGPTASTSTRGTEQFGLAFTPADTNTGVDAIDPALSALYSDPADAENRFRLPNLTFDQLAPLPAYQNGTGYINGETDNAQPTASFAFVAESNTIPEKIASNNQNVISCATAKMRYIANIGADTPAGVYTTKINYLAAPQY